MAGGTLPGDCRGLAPKALFGGRALRPGTDIRSLFMSVLQDHWALDRAALGKRVFPDAGGVVAIPGLVRV